MNASGTTKILISSCASGLCGKVAWRGKAPGQNELQIGATILAALNKTNKPRVWKGKNRRAGNRQLYTAYVTLEGKNRLLLESCAIGGQLCDKEVWTRSTL